MPSPVIDLSHHNPTPNWEQLKAGGVVGVILKATEGTTYVDNTFASRRSAAKAAGLCLSSYHFMRPGKIGAQVDHYLNVVQPVNGERVCLDHEDVGVSIADLEAAVDRLLADGRGLQVTIYSGHVIKEQLGSKRSETLAKTSLWIAQYTSAANPSWPTGTWPSWSLWQWTDREKVPGISQPVDGNRWNGSTENLIKWFGPAEQPAPAPEPEPEIATVEITTSGHVRVVVNGQVVTYE